MIGTLVLFSRYQAHKNLVFDDRSEDILKGLVPHSGTTNRGKVETTQKKMLNRYSVWIPHWEIPG